MVNRFYIEFWRKYVEIFVFKSTDWLLGNKPLLLN